MTSKKQLLALLVLLLCTLFSCKEERVPEVFQPRNDHEAYQKALQDANLLETALGKEWLNSASSSLLEPDPIDLPYEEAFFVDNTSAKAISYSFSAKKGEKIQISIAEIAADTMKRFVDLFRVDSEEFVHIASADSTGHLLSFEPRRDASYILRFQSELLRGGTFKITFENEPTLAFPVAGKNHGSIISYWGDPRDGGNRSHDGIDIYAPLGTPVIAPTDGTVKSIDDKGIGGKAIWLEDAKRPHNLYFAHLDNWSVKRGEKVKTGDTIGFVGNTGNAFYSSPHLHFGIYTRNSMKAFNPLKSLGFELKTVNDDLGWLGSEMRLTTNAVIYKDSRTHAQLSKLERNQIARIIALNDKACKVELPDGQVGYISKRELTINLRPIQKLVATTEVDLYQRPDHNATIGSIPLADGIQVLGKNDDFLRVKTTSGQSGWIKKGS